MNTQIKSFFSIEDSFHLEWADIATLLTIANVVLLIANMWWAPIIGIVNAVAGLAINTLQKAHINSYVTQLSLVVLNIFFLL